MSEDEVPKDLKKRIWMRDEFTCKSCGKTLSWDDMQIGYLSDGEDEEMIALCRECLQEGKTRPVFEEEKKYVISLIRQLFKQVMWEDRQETKDEIISDLNRKIDEIREENDRIRNQMEERGRIAISFKRKFEGERNDFKRFRDRVESDIERKSIERTRSMTMGVIESLDNLDRAIREAEKRKGGDDQGDIEGLRSIKKGLLKTLEDSGVKSIYPEGQRFDPNFHEAIETVEKKEVKNNTVLEVHLPGYSLNGSIIRPAKVSVSQGGPPWPKEKRIEKEEEGELEEFELEEEEESDKSPPDRIPLGSGEEEDILVVKPKTKKR